MAGVAHLLSNRVPEVRRIPDEVSFEGRKNGACIALQHNSRKREVSGQAC